jgi:hypothetical protein
LILTRDSCRLRAAEIGPATQEIVGDMLRHRPEDRLRTAGRLLALQERFGATRLEAACARALRFGDPAYTTVKRILEQGLDLHPPAPTPSAPPAFAFVRSAAELMGHVLGGRAWK